jgi:nitroimidazol reductase NimA-like FMN-containing flavoprotein (pyridoxamine 5'-phosphate oxidase superfamily)
LGRIAFVYQGSPVIVPVNFAVFEHTLVFKTSPSTTLARAATGRAAVFEVDQTNDALEIGTSVIVRGELREVARRERELVQRAAVGLRAWVPERDHHLQIVPSHVSGRRINPHLDDDGLVADGG